MMSNYPAGVTDNDPHFNLPSVGDDKEDTCYLCGFAASFNIDCQVQECDRCERPVCSECAEVDYDFVGDPGRYVNCQWICDSLKGGCK
jgi:hypothetical protein